jgi:hypothetical protein
MPMMPAICETCNATFPSGFFFSNATEIYLEGNTAGPCPKCGGMGRIPDGLYDFVGSSIRLLTGPARTVEVSTTLLPFWSKVVEIPSPVPVTPVLPMLIHHQNMSKTREWLGGVTGHPLKPSRQVR